jgi:hypothetical protein
VQAGVTIFLSQLKGTTMENQAIEYISPSDLQSHPENPRKGDIGVIIESIEANGWYGTIVAQRSTKYALAGNHRLMAAKALKLETVPVYWVDVNDSTARRIMLADNRSGDIATYDDEALSKLLAQVQQTEGTLFGTGFADEDLEALLRDINSTEINNNGLGSDVATDNSYTQKVKIPQYEIVGEEPSTDELLDTTKAEELRKNIDKASLPQDVKDFLTAATWRHVRFNYGKIAEYYPHQPKEIQELMEQSVLVIIDADDAIANGYAKFARTIEDLTEQDNEDI